jgi:YbbR domain-containing protein
MLSNLSLKIFSVLIALILWLVVATSDVSDMKVYVPIKLVNITEGYVAVTDDNLIYVHIKASNMILKNLNHNDIKISVDVSDFKTGTTRYRIRKEDIKVPGGVEVIETEPQEIFITVDKLVNKKVRVVPTFIGEPKEGFKIANVTSIPDTVTVQGAKSKISDKDFIETLPINISGRSETMIYGIGMKMGDGFKSVSPEQIEVYITFKEDIVTKTIENYPVELLADNKDFKYILMPDKVKIKISGRKDKMKDKYIRDKVKLFVKMDNETSVGKYLKQIEYKTNDLKLISIEPLQVRIEVEVK